MEKTLTIDGKQVRFKSTAATAKRYKAQFGSDFFADLLKMGPIIKAVEKGQDFDSLDYAALQHIDFEVFYNLIWVLAKTADKTIPEPLDWLDSFTEFPIMDIMPELQDLMMASFQGKKKTNHPAMKNQ